MDTERNECAKSVACKDEEIMEQIYALTKKLEGYVEDLPDEADEHRTDEEQQRIKDVVAEAKSDLLRIYDLLGEMSDEE